MKLLAHAMTALVLAGCAAPPVFEWTPTGYGKRATHYDWRVLDIDTYRKYCGLNERSASYNGGACAYAPLGDDKPIVAPALDIDTHEPVVGVVIGALCMIYASLSLPSAAFARSGYPGDYTTLLEHELRHCKGETHRIFTIDMLGRR